MSAVHPASRPGTEVTRILVADDDPIMRSILVSKLATLRVGAIDIVETEDGQQAWRQLAAGNFQLALVDLEMPVMDGIALIQCARSHPRTKHLPIVVVTSRDDSPALKAALEAGASSYLTKPIYWSMFNAHIEHLIRLAQTSLASADALSLAKDEARAIEMRATALHGKLAVRLDRIADAAALARASLALTQDSTAAQNAFLAVVREAEAAREELKTATLLASDIAAGRTERHSALPPLSRAS